MRNFKILVVAILLVLSGLFPRNGNVSRLSAAFADTYATSPSNAPIPRIETGQHLALISRIDLDRTGHWLVSASHDKTVRVWDTRSGKLIQVFRPPIAAGNEGKLYATAISPDGELVACGGWTKSGSDTGHTIYFFWRQNGQLAGRAEELTNVALNMAFSPDGRYLAVSLGGKNGIRIFEMGHDRATARKTGARHEVTPRLVAEDHQYGNSSYGIHFSADGRQLVTSSDDGFVRIYDLSGLPSTRGIIGNDDSIELQPRLKQRVFPNTPPFFVKFSPDGTKIAVSQANNGGTFLLSSQDLSPAHTLDYENVHAAGSSGMAWSPDGSFLYTTSPCGASEQCSNVRRWSAAGQQLLPGLKIRTGGSILDLASLPNGGLVAATSDPSIIIQNEDKGNVTLSSPSTGNFRDNHEGLLISRDGSRFRFGYEAFGKAPASFSLPERRLSLPPEPDDSLLHPVTETANAHVEGWKNTQNPTVNKRKLSLDPNELSRSLSISTDSRLIVIGGDWYLRCFDVSGRELWKAPAPGTVWATNISSNGRVVLAAYGDGTIRWHRMTDGKELLAFFPHSDRKKWVVWTPEGFFDHSPGGEELIGWHLNRGREKEAEFIPVGKLYNQFYRPDLVTMAFEGSGQVAYASDSDIRKVLAANTLPPKVRFLTHSGKAETHDTVIRAELCDNGGGIGDITLYLNGMPVTISKNGRGLKIVRKDSGSCSRFEHPITLADGDNEISIMAYNKAMTIESNRDSITLFRSPEHKARPDLYILSVAVNSYRDADLKLSYPVPDAKAIVESFRAKSGMLFGKIITRQLFDAEVTKSGMEKAFATIGTKTSRNDVFVLFVAGHGITGNKDGAYYFLPHDFRYTDESAVAKQGISMDNFKGFLANVNALKSLILLDTCNSGSFSEAIASRGMVEKTAITKLTRAVGRATIVASSKNQVALEGFEGHGAFTWTILDGLKGEAADTSGRITINGLATYVEELLPKITYKKWGFEQIPQKSLQGMDFQIGMR